MKMRDMQRHIEESLGKLGETVLPTHIRRFRPKVSVYHSEVNDRNRRRKVLESADVSSLNPGKCEIVITFEPIDEVNPGNSSKAENPPQSQAKFNPIRIRGGMASDTVIEDRTDRS